MPRTVTVHQPTTGTGPDGRPITINPGTFRIADVDGVSDAVLYLVDGAGNLLACVDGSDPNITISETGADGG